MADKIVQLVDKNSNNLYPVAGAVIDNAVSTGAISSQAVTNPKIENGAVNGVENDATAIGTAKLALDTVGTPNLRDASVTSDKIDFTTFTQYEPVKIEGFLANNTTSYQQLSGTYTLPANGLYSITTNINTPSSGTTKFILFSRTKIGDRTLFPASTMDGDAVETISIAAYSGNNFARFICSTIFFGNAGETISVQTSMGNWTGRSRHNTVIQRIW